jgi:molybdopterin-guanine dinucleotide biosynthesis protein A
VSGPVVGGVFVGGAGTRMGGRAKGLMQTRDGRTLVERARDVLMAAGVTEVVLVGRRPGYEFLALPTLDDSPESTGPLGGLVALLRHASEHGVNAFALACDMPYVPPRLVGRLIRAQGPVVAPRRGELWEPLCALYTPEWVLEEAERRVVGDNHSLQGLLDAVGAVELPLEAGEADGLKDWDSEKDVP